MPNSPRPTVGLALSGGAARGLAHVGAVRALIEKGVPIDCVAGTSAGSIIGAALAAGLSIDDIERLGRELRWRHVGSVTLSRRGIQSNHRLEKYLRNRLPVTRFEELSMPFAAVATDLKTGAEVVMRDQGDVPFAIRASCTIPGLYVPVIDQEGRELVDGGLVAVVPSAAARALGADIVIAVDVNGDGARFFGSGATHVIGVMMQSLMVVQKTASHQQLANSDFVIQPKVGHVRWDRLGMVDELIDAGYAAGVASAADILAIIDATATKQTDTNFAAD